MRVLATILICFMPWVAYGGTKVNSSLPPFNTSLDQLPKAYNGHSLERVYRDLAKVQSKISKSDFENTPGYEARIAKLKSKLTLAALPLNSFFAYKVKDLTYTYDADEEILDVTLDSKDVRDDRNQIIDSRWSIKGFKIGSSHGQYLASNAFGATALVDKYEIESVDLMPATSDDSLKTYSIKKIKPDYASRISKNLAAIIIYQIDNLSLYTGIFYSKATFTDPVDLLNTTYYIEAQVKDVWIYDYSTGNILLKAKTQRVEK